MLDEIKAKLSETYAKTDSRGLFFSLFDAAGTLLVSNGVLQTEKNVFDLTDILYHGVLEKFEKVTKKIVLDVVMEINAQPDIQKLLSLSTKERGIFAINKETNTSGIVLPNTQGVTDAKVALSLLKQKYNLSGNVQISTFKTRRLVIGL
jgi:hypothetical protein